MTHLSRTDYRDRVYACWLGKNCGGTLGEPLERMFGEPEPFDVWWYPELREGGLPNDDLELQLIWLKAVEERGFGLAAQDLAEYWLDHVGYNFDEYGRSKTNLRLGLLPPVSGAHNNPFKDCMGCPIRSEIWACIAPGLPELAVRYAYEDAVCDHAGGEGVYGELFNTAVESAAFVVHDRDALLDLGLSYIPEDCRTAQAIRAAREAHGAGLAWKEARSKVLETTPHYIAQYAPINLGFQTIGWLYGEDFGDSLCKAVNCGYDTDCTGATLGSILGILAGTAGLPTKWTEPLGEGITTNESWGGIKHVYDGSNPIPATLDALTERVCDLGERLLVLGNASIRITDRTSLGSLNPEELHSSNSIERLWEADSMEVSHRLQAIPVKLSYGDDPVVRLGETKRLRVQMENPHPDRATVSASLSLPPDWGVSPRGAYESEIEPGETAEISFDVWVHEAAALRNSNSGTLSIQAEGRPVQPLLPVVLLGAQRWQVCGPFTVEAESPETLLTTSFEPEADLSIIGEQGLQIRDRGHEWSIVNCPDDSLASLPLHGSGVWYARTFLHSPAERDVRFGTPANCPTKLWLNGESVLEFHSPMPVRPDYSGDKHSGNDESRADVRLLEGWNEVLIKFVRSELLDTFDAHFITSYPPMFDGTPDIGHTAFPWEVDSRV